MKTYVRELSNRIDFSIRKTPEARCLDEFAFIFMLQMKHNGATIYEKSSIEIDDKERQFTWLNVRLSFPDRYYYASAFSSLREYTTVRNEVRTIKRREIGRLNGVDSGRRIAEGMLSKALVAEND
ncbi:MULTISPECIES: hypothetical protein [Rhizobium]|uniref:hypothetical protein n=1 Tax=Rhizobium TaxID=379 RepID=UPI00195BF305|nr:MULTISPECIES: hypothetical protein [Rhizobium]MBM7050310.1 hypothetical protein [Rhizobium lusitanum]